jgi:hypothetical protein
MPPKSTFLGWVRDINEIHDHYTRAIEVRATVLFDDILTIADCEDNDMYTDDEGKERVNHDVINRDRLRVDARKWALSKMLPKVYGDKLDVTSKGEKINTSPPVIEVYNVGPKLAGSEEEIED